MNNLIPTKIIKEDGTVAIRNGMKPNSNQAVPIERKPKWLRGSPKSSTKFQEVKKIVPAIKILRKTINILGPFPSDSFFIDEYRKRHAPNSLS